ncbi:MAG TPA: DUF2332 domain-containing protein [Rhizomicrobium sp.]|nr:DUF2332 domain-containing protein [Rhizomicrobium sp.]
MYANENDYWRDFAEDARRLGSPLYQQLALAIDGDDRIKALASRRRKGQPSANLLLGAVHFLLLKGADHPLRDFYATLGGGNRDEAIFLLFRDFVIRHESQLLRLIERNVTNTNEVGRSAILRPGFAALAQEEAAPLHLIEIGPSAGLNLIWDRYGLRYEREGMLLREVSGGLTLTCELRGENSPPIAPLPRIAGRIGLERDPVDLKDADQRDWLRALVWPDQPQRLARLDAAIALYLKDPMPIRHGDALDLLAETLATVPPEEAVCVYHTITVYQFSAAMREALTALLVTAGLRRPVWHLAFEFDGGRDYEVRLTHHRDGGSRSRKLGLAQPHGAWLEWLEG